MIFTYSEECILVTKNLAFSYCRRRSSQALPLSYPSFPSSLLLPHFHILFSKNRVAQSSSKAVSASSMAAAPLTNLGKTSLPKSPVRRRPSWVEEPIKLEGRKLGRRARRNAEGAQVETDRQTDRQIRRGTSPGIQSRLRGKLNSKGKMRRGTTLNKGNPLA